jgi:hypothetical protein
MRAKTSSQSGEEEPRYSCWHVLNFPKRQHRTGLTPKDFSDRYVACAKRYPRKAEEEIIEMATTPLGDEAYKQLTDDGYTHKLLMLLFENNFTFSPAFKEAMAVHLDEKMRLTIQPVVALRKAQGIAISEREAHEYQKATPDCAAIEQFIIEHGSKALAKKIIPLCKLKNRLASAPK